MGSVPPTGSPPTVLVGTLLAIGLSRVGGGCQRGTSPSATAYIIGVNASRSAKTLARESSNLANGHSFKASSRSAAALGSTEAEEGDVTP